MVHLRARDGETVRLYRGMNSHWRLQHQIKTAASVGHGVVFESMKLFSLWFLYHILKHGAGEGRGKAYLPELCFDL